MNRTPIAVTLAALLALAACGSDDDDDDGPDAAAQGAGDEAGLPGPPDAGDTSEFNPDLDSGDTIDTEPSGTAPAAGVVGLWNASSGAPGGEDEMYVRIDDDGLYTEYDYQMDDVGSGENCYLVQPLRLDFEDAGSNAYSLGDGRELALAPGEDGGTLMVTEIDESGEADGVVLSWTREVDAIDFNACEG